MNRLDKFRSLKDHLWYGKIFRRLKDEEVDLCVRFIEEQTDLEPNQFEAAVNNFFLDKPKPKNWALITELLVSCKKP